MDRFRSTNWTRRYPHGRMQRIIERGLPAAILVLVALLQIYLTQTANLSPWKGGGFGMFGAIDAPAMRVIQAEALDQDGNSIQLDVYSALDDRTIRRIRTLPRQSDLEQIAPQFVAQFVVPTTVERQAIYEKLQLENPDLLGDQNLPPDRITNLLPDLPTHPLAQPLYRLKTMYDPDVPAAVKTVKAIRLQWWRLRFDHVQHQLWAEPLSQVVEAGAWQ
ncbi:hypothetical protein C7B61_09540 [filamentous cyanobacterium CCP1]|nr:hypothetical protein C7B76_02410 [filamentous cyanobacterium CCP2]PSB66790.1 hypothetical protein C7B61_09540 [filamentous cyanobacterium CCP1]